ncbi:MAG: hypothetical protein ACOH2N_16975 [Devosia sp.]
MISSSNSPLLLNGPQLNAVMLPEGIIRGLLPAKAERSAKFNARYERSVLFYDVYWSADGRRIILQGPPPIDLGAYYGAARYVCQPSGAEVRARPFHSELVYLVALDAPVDTTHIDIVMGGTTQRAEVGQNHSPFFADTNLLFTLSKDNDLDWIIDWARFHQVNQGVDAVLLFDNMSTRYSASDLEAALLSVDGLKRVGVVPVPFNYPLEDPALPKRLFWAHFLQPGIIVNMFRRYGMATKGILNCDIDELAVPLGSETVFESAARSRSGTVYFRGCWIEPVPDVARPGGYRHRDFTQVVAGTDVSRGSTDKWALTPHRRWLQNLAIHPYAHALVNRPMLTRRKPGTAFIAHFKAISNGWKYDRSVVPKSSAQLQTDPALVETMRRAFPEER